MAEKRGNTGKLKYEFSSSACLEVEFEENKWARVTPNEFRAFAGQRRISYFDSKNEYITEKYDGPTYLYGTNVLVTDFSKNGIVWENREKQKYLALRVNERI